VSGLVGSILVLGIVLTAPAAGANEFAWVGLHPPRAHAWSGQLDQQAHALAPRPRFMPSIPVGNAPQSAAEDYPTHTLYVANSGDNTVSVVNLATCTSGNVSGCARTSPTVTVGNLPLGVAVDEATDTVYVANAVDNTVSVIDGAACNSTDRAGCSNTPVTVPVGAFDNQLAVDPVTNMVFVTDQDASPGTVSVIDGNSCTGSDSTGCASQPFATVAVGGGPSGVGVNPATNTAYVANTAVDSNGQPVPNGDTLSVINGASCTPTNPVGCAAVGTVRVGTGPVAVAIDPATNTVYAANAGGNAFKEGSVSVVDGSTCDGSDPSGCASQTAPQVTVGAGPASVAIDSSNRSIYVTNGDDDTVSVIDARSCNAHATSACDDRPPTIAVEGGPNWTVVDPARHTVYVAAQAANSVAVVDDRSCDARRSSGCRHPVPTVAAGSFPNTAASDERFQTIYIGDTNAFQPPYTVAMINARSCNAADRRGCARPPATVGTDEAPNSIAVNQRTNTVYIAENDTLQVTDAAICNAHDQSGCQTTASVPAGATIVAVDPSTNTIYADNVRPDGSGYVSVIDGRHCDATDTSGCAAQTSASTATVAVGHFPFGIAVDSTGHTLYVANGGDQTVSVIDTTHCHAGDTSGCANQSPPTVAIANAIGPRALAVDPATHTVYAADASASRVGALSLIDTTHCRAGDTSQCGSQTPAMTGTPGVGGQVQIDPLTGLVYVVNVNDSSVSVIDGKRCNTDDTTGCQDMRTVEVGSRPTDLTLDQANRTVYVPNIYDNDASVFGMLRSS
jgi:YVTN family beta-propeller protein